MACIFRGQRSSLARALALLPALLLVAVPEAIAQLYEQPVLVVDPGMHTAVSYAAAADAMGRFLATGSDDKSVRIWSASDGKLLRTIRMPTGPGEIGQVRAVAMSPDGNTVAAGTKEAADERWAIYLFDRNAGTMTQRIGELPYVSDIVFSADGRYLAAAAGNGLRVFDRDRNWSEAFHDETYGGRSLGATFATDGRLATSSSDRRVRLYDRNFKLVATQQIPKGTPFRLAFRPGGEVLAVGNYDRPSVDLLDGHGLAPRPGPRIKAESLHKAESLQDRFAEVAWSGDGQTLFAAGFGYADPTGNDNVPVLSWGQGGHGPQRAVPAKCIESDSPTLALVALSEGRLLVVKGIPCFVMLNADGSVRLAQRPPGGDFRGQEETFSVSEDGTVIDFEFELSSLRFNLRTRGLSDRRPADDHTRPPKQDGLRIENVPYSPELNGKPKLNGKPIDIDDGDRAFGHAIYPDGNRFVLGTDWSLYAFDANGKKLWRCATPGGIVWAVNITGNGRLVVAAYNDGTIRWHRLSDGKELLALFVHRDGQRWVAWTPQGYYDASAGADELIGWHINHGYDRVPDFYPAKRFSERFNRPDIVARVLDTLDEDEAVRQADAVSKRKAPAPIVSLLPPVVRILSPPDLSSVTTSPVDVTYLIRSPTPVTGVTVLVDGRPTTTASPTEIMSSPEGSVRNVSVPMPQHNAVISLVAANAQTSSEAAVVHVGWHGEMDWYKPDLYVLAVGVTNYKDPSLNLRYPAKDEADFATILRAQEGGLYKHVEVRELPDKLATREEIRKGLSWLKKTPTRDVAMLFLSGHGQNDAGGHYHYLPYDTDETDLDLTTIQDFEIEDFLSKVPGKVIVFLDTCFAGGAAGAKGPTQPDIDALANKLAAADKGVVVFTSSTGRQFSLEREEWQNGAFTKALVEALKGGADYQHDKRISIAALEVYLSHRVQELTGGEQSPTSTKPKTIPDLVIATVVP